jgi:hypothetical protein
MTLVEAAISVVLVSTVFVASLQAMSLSGTIRFRAVERARAQALGAALLDEILQQSYAPPSSSSSSGGGISILGIITIGGNGGGSGGTSSGPGRTGFDDVDDYHNYSDAPPTNRDGTRILGAAVYARRVRIQQVEPLDLSRPATSDTGIKLITVTVTRNGRTLATRTAIRGNVP